MVPTRFQKDPNHSAPCTAVSFSTLQVAGLTLVRADAHEAARRSPFALGRQLSNLNRTDLVERQSLAPHPLPAPEATWRHT